jgi:hypothetical protein
LNKWRVRKNGRRKKGEKPLLFKNPQNLQQNKATATQASLWQELNLHLIMNLMPFALKLATVMQ